jgi:YidC/Oxa1 family membrane protein insertase
MSTIWQAFVGFLESVILQFFVWTGSGGLAIIIFTIIVRSLILPLTLKSLQSSRKIQQLQPQIKEIQRKYGKDPQKLQEETAKLYRDNKINPLGGCLPMLLQLPIFFAVYQAVLHLTQVSVPEYAGAQIISTLQQQGINITDTFATIGLPRLGGSFLWLENLGQPDPYYILGILSVIFQLIVQLMAMPRVQDPQQKAMTQAMLVMPLMFAYIGFTFPAGAVLYWVIGSVFSMVQQYVISGWGSLANYLKFLPPDRGLYPPINPNTVAVATADGNAEAPKKVDFWDVLRPLTEQGNQSSEDDNNDADSDEEENSSVSSTAAPVRRQGQQLNPRRRNKSRR